MKALRFINSDLVQRLLVVLLVMDVFILLGELGMWQLLICYISFSVMVCRHITYYYLANNDLILQPLMHLSRHARLSYEMQYHAVHQSTMTIPIAFLEEVVVMRRFATIH